MRVSKLSIALVLLAVCATASFSLTTYVEWAYYGLTGGLSTFGIHPVLMAAGFLILAPVASVLFAVRDGLKVHSDDGKALFKMLHATLHLSALLCGSFGLWSIWLTHERSRFQYHFQTLHSWFGIVGFGCYCIQWGAGACVFLLCPEAARARFVDVHRWCGRILIYSLLIVCVMGSLACVWKNGLAEPHPHASGLSDWVLQNVGGCLMLVELFVAYYLLERRAASRSSGPRTSRAPATGGQRDRFGNATAPLSEPLLT